MGCSNRFLSSDLCFRAFSSKHACRFLPCSHIPSLYRARCIHIRAHIHSCIDTCVQVSTIKQPPANVISIKPDINALSQSGKRPQGSRPGGSKCQLAHAHIAPRWCSRRQLVLGVRCPMVALTSFHQRSLASSLCALWGGWMSQTFDHSHMIDM